MPLHIPKTFGRTKSSTAVPKTSPKDSEAKDATTTDSRCSDSIYSQESIDIEEAKRQAYQERRAREAEEYLANRGITKHGFVSFNFHV